MLASLLGTHSEIITIPEFPFKFEILSKVKSETDLVRILKKSDRFKFWDIQFPNETGSSDSKVFIEQLIQKYSDQHEKSKSKYWVDHTNENLDYAVLLNSEYPTAKFIFLIRDGRSNYASVKSLDWGPVDPVTAAKWWMRSIAIGFSAQHYLQNKLLIVKYEEILKDPIRKLEEIMNFIGVRFEDDQLRGNGFTLPGYTQNQHSLVGKKLDNSRIDSWKFELSNKEVGLFELQTKELLPLLGYSLSGVPKVDLTLKKKLYFYSLRLFKQQIINPIKRRLRSNKHLGQKD